MNSRFTSFMARLKTQRMLSILVVLLTLTVGILIGTVLSRTAVRGNVSSPDAALLPMQSPQQLSNTFGQVTRQVGSAVVNINTESIAKPRRRLRRGPGQGQGDDNGGGNNNDDLQDFFNRFFGGGGRGGQGGQGGQGGDDEQSPFGGREGPNGGRSRSLDYGVILNSNGYIITNFHVVEARPASA